MAAIKYSRQRELIKNYLSSTKEHPTADKVYDEIRKLLPNISLGTVYRNLNLLVSTGEIMKVSCGDGCDHFDGNPNPHYHFICKECGCVMDLDITNEEPFYQMNDIADENFRGTIEGNVTYFYGRCPKCLNNPQLLY